MNNTLSLTIVHKCQERIQEPEISCADNTFIYKSNVIWNSVKIYLKIDDPATLC